MNCLHSHIIKAILRLFINHIDQCHPILRRLILILIRQFTTASHHSHHHFIINPIRIPIDCQSPRHSIPTPTFIPHYHSNYPTPLPSTLKLQLSPKTYARRVFSF